MTTVARRRMHWLPAWLMLFALLGAGQVLPALHFLLVAHRVCAEHGETVHAELRPEEGESSASLAGESAEIRLRPSPALPEHEHEHCSVLGLARAAAAALASPACTSALPAAWEHRALQAERAAHVHVALLLYAPKLAPPA